jgi:hypothetical protein
MAMRRFLFAIALCFTCVLALARGDDQKSAETKFHYLDLQPKGNSMIDQQFSGDDNGEGKLSPGEQTLEGVKFKIGAKYIQLRSTNLPNHPAKVEGIKVGRAAAKLHLLHATGWSTADDTIIGEYVVTWEDDSSVTIPIRYGKDLLDWWYDDSCPEPSEAKIAWKGANLRAQTFGKKARLYLTSWDSPKPDKKVKTIDFITTKETPCSPFCVAITVEGK